MGVDFLNHYPLQRLARSYRDVISESVIIENTMLRPTNKTY